MADQLGELGRIGDVKRLAATVRIRRRRAPPVQVVAPFAPAAAVELGHGRDEDARPVRAVHPILRPADRQLPAHLGLGLERVPSGAQRIRVQRASGTPRETRPVEEDAGTVDDAGTPPVLIVADTVLLDDVQLPGLGLRAAPILPVGGGELLGEPAHPPLVGLVGEERPMAATTVVGATFDYAAAAAAEDACPARAQ